MARNRRSFRRDLGERSYRKIFAIATEGEKTEPSYFDVFCDHSVIYVYCVETEEGEEHLNSPRHVMERMEQHLADEEIKDNYEAWLVVDKDRWTDDQLDDLCEWSQKADNRGLAVSNRQFEYWLLLHFEDGVGVRSAADCARRLRQHLPDYDKEVEPKDFSEDLILQAISRARSQDSPPCEDWPREPWRTTVYRLVDSIVASQAASR